MLLNKILERDAHLLLHDTRVVDVTADAEQLGALVAFAPEAREPRGTASADGGGDSDRLDVSDGRRASEQSNVSGEGRLETRLALLALQTLNQRRLLSADVRPSPTMEVHVEAVPRTTGVFSNEPSLVGLVDGLLDMRRLLEELTTDVDVRGARVHRASRDQAALNELVGITTHDFSVLAGPRLSLVGVDDEIARSRVFLPSGLVHEAPLETTGKTSSSSSPEPRILDGLDDPGVTLEDNLFRLMPVTTGL